MKKFKKTIRDAPTRYANFRKLGSRLDNPQIIATLTPNNPWVCFSNEIGVSDLSVAGGLGYLAGDWVLLAGKLGIPFIGISLYYRTKWKQAIDKNFNQVENYYYSSHPGKHQFRKLKKNGKKCLFKFRSNNLDTDIEVYIKDLSGNPLITLFEPGIRGLYDGIKEEEHRLYQSSVLGFIGVRVMEYLGIKPTIFHLNESSTAIAGVSYLDRLCQEGFRLSQALKFLNEKTIFTNHTISPAAEPIWEREQLKKYLFPNLKNCEVKNWLDEVISEEKGKLQLSNIAMRLSQKVNAVSKLHAKKIYDNYGINFRPITNAISNRWIYPEIWQTYLKHKLFDEKYRLPGKDYRRKLENFSSVGMLEIKNRAKKELISYLTTERKDQYGKKIVLPKNNIKIAVWARRFDSYKRPGLLFTDLNKLSFILKKYNIHILLSGKAHQTDSEMKKVLQDILKKIDTNEILKKRVHFIQNYDWKLAKKFAGADILLNTPKVGWEACGTSWEKAIMNWMFLCTTADGGPADVCDEYEKKKEKPFFLIEGETDEDASKSVYRNLEFMGNLLNNNHKWKEMIIRQLRAFLPIANGPRMMKEYLEFRFG